MQIARSLVKYGYSNFRLEILEYCVPENAVEREQYYLDLLKPEYNTLLRARSSLGYRHTYESLVKMSGEDHTFFGKTHSELTKEKFRLAMLGKNNPNFGKPLTCFFFLFFLLKNIYNVIYNLYVNKKRKKNSNKKPK